MQGSEYQHQNGMVLPQTVFRCPSFQGEGSGFRIIKGKIVIIAVMTMKITTIMILAIVRIYIYRYRHRQIDR